MKILPKQYAQVLYDLTENKKTETIKPVISRLVKILFENNDISKLDKIINEFNKIWDNARGVVEARIIGVREMDADIIKFLKDYIVKLSGSENVILKKELDKNILGGVIIKYGDKILDASLRTRLRLLEEKMKK